MPYDKSGVIVLVPAYKEELTISMVVALSRRYAERVIVVDDGSPDRTSELAMEAGAEVIRQDPNQGKAAALKVGMSKAKEYSPRCVVIIDGDGQMDPAKIPVIATPVLEGKADLVIGSRFIGERQGIPRYRILGQKILNRVTNMGTGANVTDSQSGYRGLSPAALKNMDFKSQSYNIESDMIAHFSQINLRIMEVPITVRYDVPNGHKQNPVKHGFSVLNRLISFVGYKRPVLIFGVPGVISFLAGLFLCIATFLEERVTLDWSLATQGIFGVSLFGLGIFLIFAALVLHSLGIMMQSIFDSLKK